MVRSCTNIKPARGKREREREREREVEKRERAKERERERREGERIWNVSMILSLTVTISCTKHRI